MGEAQDVDEGVHVRLRSEVDAGAHMAQGGVDVLRWKNMAVSTGGKQLSARETDADHYCSISSMLLSETEVGWSAMPLGRNAWPQVCPGVQSWSLSSSVQRLDQKVKTPLSPNYIPSWHIDCHPVCRNELDAVYAAPGMSITSVCSPACSRAPHLGIGGAEAVHGPPVHVLIVHPHLPLLCACHPCAPPPWLANACMQGVPLGLYE